MEPEIVYCVCVCFFDLLTVLCFCMSPPPPSGLLSCHTSPLVEQIILPWLQSFCSLIISNNPFLEKQFSQSFTWQATKLLANLGLAVVRNKVGQHGGAILLAFSLPSFPTSFTCPLLLSGLSPMLLGWGRPLVIDGKGMKEKVVIGLLSSPLGSGMRPDLIRHQDGPLMDMSFNPFPPGGRNGNWRGRGETPQFNWSITFLNLILISFRTTLIVKLHLILSPRVALCLD